MSSFHELLSAQINAVYGGVLISGVQFRGVLERERDRWLIIVRDYKETEEAKTDCSIIDKQASHSIVGYLSPAQFHPRRNGAPSKTTSKDS